MRWSKYFSDPKRDFALTSTFVLDQKEIENLDAVYTGGEHRREGPSLRGALDEFVMLWVEEDINCQLGPNQEAITGATMQTLLEQTG